MKLDSSDIKFLENYTNEEFYFEKGLIDYFSKKYSIDNSKIIVDQGERYLNFIDYSLKIDNLTINFGVERYPGKDDEWHMKLDSSGVEIFDEVKDEIVIPEESLEESTKNFITKSVQNYYFKAIEAGATISKVEGVGANMYKVKVGNMELTYLGTADGTANVIGASGDIF